MDMCRWDTARGRTSAGPDTGRRRGVALYLTALSISVLVAGTGLTLVAVQRSERTLQTSIVRMHQARWCARAGVKQAMLYMEQVSDWRTRAAGGVIFSALAVGDGTVTVEVFDDLDGNLANNDAQPVRIVATGSAGGATSRISGQLNARAHPALRQALFASTGRIEFKGTSECRGPARAHQDIKSVSTVTLADDAAFETMTGYTIENPLTPTSYAVATVAGPTVNLPFYAALATNIRGDYGTRCDLQGYNLTPTNNPEGAANANGIYRLDAGARDVLIKDFHLRGTLIITNTGGKPVSFEGGCWIEPGPLNYPVLLIDAPDQDIDLHMASTTLAELGTNLVIPQNGSNHTPLLHLGVDFNENGLLLDSFLTQIRGVIWTNGSNLGMNTGGWSFVGTAICRSLTINHSIKVDNDLTLLYRPMPGFVESGMQIVPGSFREVP